MARYKLFASDSAKLRRAEKRASKLVGGTALITLTDSGVEKYAFAQDPENVVAFNNAVEKWLTETAYKMRGRVMARSVYVARNLRSKAETDKYGLIYRVGFTFPREGIYLHKGAARGYGGDKGSKWRFLKTVKGNKFPTAETRTTNPESLGRIDSGRRHAFPWFNPVLDAELPKLEKVAAEYFTNMAVNAAGIYID